VPVAASLWTTSSVQALVEATRNRLRSPARTARQKSERPMLTLEKARANRTPIEWDGYTPPVARARCGSMGFQ